MVLKRCIILGAGISGLSLAWYLRKQFSSNELEITIIESHSKAGGWISTEQVGDFVFEAGPRCLRGDDALPLIHDVGLATEVIESAPQAKTKFLAYEGALLALPTPRTLFSNPIGRKCLKALLGYPFRKKMKGDDLSCGDYFSSRFGADFTQHVIDPMVAGIWGANPYNLSFNASLGTMKLRAQKLYTLKGGLGTLPKRICERLEATILLDTKPLRVEESPDEVHVICKERTITGDFLFSSLHPSELEPLFAQDPLSRYIPKVPRAGIIVCAVGYRQAVSIPKGFGFLASSTEDPELLGVSFDSMLFPGEGRPYQTRLTCMLGGERAPHLFSLSDEEIKEKAKAALSKYLHIHAKEDAIGLMRAPESISVYPVGHLQRLKALEEAVALRRIAFLGSGLYGVSVPACIEKSRVLAKLFQDTCKKRVYA